MRTIATIGLCTAAAAAAGPSLVGLWHESGSIVCDLLAVNPFTGSNVTIASNVSACGDVTQTYPAFSALNTDTGLIEVAISTAPSIFAYDPVTGAESTVAALPVYNNSDPYFGLVHVAGTSYLVTQYNLYAISGGALQQVMSVSLPGGTVVAAAEAVGTNPARIFAADEDGTTVAVITLGANAAVTSFTSGVSRPWDVQYRPGGSNDLIVLASYKLYAVDSTTGASNLIMPIPDGPGYPRVNGITPDGATFWFMDFSFVYTIDVATGNVTSKNSFTAAPRVVGFPVWMD